MARDVESLLKMRSRELDALFSRSPPGDLPDGPARGTAIMAPGTRLSPVIAGLVRGLAWKGKAFDRAGGALRNRVLPFGIHTVPAKVYLGESRLDGGPCIVLDYSQTSFVARQVRDELRWIGPRLYLGRAYWRGLHVFDFALEMERAPKAGRVPPDS